MRFDGSTAWERGETDEVAAREAPTGSERETAIRRMTGLLRDAQAAHHALYGDAPHEEWPEYYARFIVNRLTEGTKHGTQAR